MSAIDVLSTTPTYGWPIPNPDDPDDVPTDLSELAVAVENTVKGLSTVPKPVVNGQWIKGVGGLPVWAAITAADVSGLPKITVGALATGPPAGPVTGDEWIANDVGTGVEWRFRYNGATSRWEFIGGPELVLLTPNAGAVALNTWQNVGAGFITIRRPGTYLVGSTTQIYNPSGGLANITYALYRNAASGANSLSYSPSISVASGVNGQATVPLHGETFNANDNLGVMAFSNAANVQFAPLTFFVLPLSIV